MSAYPTLSPRRVILLVITHEAVREWEAQLALVLSELLHKHRRGRIGPSWYTDETYIKVKGRWTYLYREIDRDGNLVDVLLSEKRERAAAAAFFRSARTVTGSVPERVTTDGHAAYPGAIRAELGEAVRHLCSARVGSSGADFFLLGRFFIWS